MERSTPTFLFNFPKRESRVGAEVFALLPSPPPLPLSLLLRVLFAFGGNGGRKSCWRIDSRATSTFEYWHTGRSSNLERKFWRNGATTRRDALCPRERESERERWQPSCGAFYSRSTCRIVSEVAWTDEARDKMRLAPRRRRRISSSPPIPLPPAPAARSADEAKKETTATGFFTRGGWK